MIPGSCRSSSLGFRSCFIRRFFIITAGEPCSQQTRSLFKYRGYQPVKFWLFIYPSIEIGLDCSVTIADDDDYNDASPPIRERRRESPRGSGGGGGGDDDNDDDEDEDNNDDDDKTTVSQSRKTCVTKQVRRRQLLEFHSCGIYKRDVGPRTMTRSHPQ
ncbi:uncharacterized protein LOC116849236 [Odontomachus brunneus]|uniref:uncharacterized protein LOC116849236 n=1 Tax=Odontomachus brunneus TaxID=486640 RepID=UPI0013F29B8E|nr:uncharacterized protein LOC116849236 [Odontomachus brunneus]